MESNKTVIMVMSGGPEAPLIFGDLEYDSRVIYLKKPFLDINSILSILRKFHLATRINHFFPLPFRKVWDNSLSLSSVNFNNEDKYNVIFINTSIIKYNIPYLFQLKEKYNIRYYLYMLDSVNTERGNEVKRYIETEGLIDKIYSFDNSDCKTFGFSYFVQPISKLRHIENKQPKYDLYFLGRTKRRENELLKMVDKYNKILNLNIKIVSDNQAEKEKLLSSGVYSDYISYEENIKNILYSKVILEVIQENQSGNTLRYQEAILYNRKLLTNNKNIINMPFYNSKYMRVFTDITELDINWIKNNEIITYNYNNEFSASKLVDDIVKD